MKDFDNQKTEGPTGTASPISKSRGKAPERAGDAEHVVSEFASQSQPDADTLRARELSHPANAAPLADLLGQLQQSHGNSYVQRVVADMNEAKSEVESQSSDRSQGLDASTRSEMESAFGENFGDVRVHTGNEGKRLNDQLDARATTRGRDIYFGAGEYNPSTREGKELLAHELTHVVQQRGSSISQAANTAGQVGDAFEQEADEVAASIVRGGRARVENRGPAPAYQRQSTRTPPSSGHVVNQFIEAVILSSGDTAGVHYEFTSRGTVFVINFRLPRGGTLLSVNPANRCQRSSPSARRETLTITRAVGESLTIEVSFRAGNNTVNLTIRLPRA